jgi:membrane associated rhomboid family serine protease
MGSLNRPVDPERALSALYASSRGGVPRVTYGFLVLCLAVTIPTLVFPDLYDVLGGLEPRRYPWQLFTAVFEHGWPGFHGSIHLALNVFLILECGRPCERLLGWRRFLALGVLSMLCNALAQLLTEGVNGSSLVIWSWGPPLFVALRWARRRDPAVAHAPAYTRLRGVLVLMYGVIVVVMAVLPYLGGWRGNPLVALVLGNLYHLVAAAAGSGVAVLAAGSIRRRLDELGVA